MGNDGDMDWPVYTMTGQSAGVNLGDEWMVEESPIYTITASGSGSGTGSMNSPTWTAVSYSGARADNQESPKYVLSGTGSKFGYGETSTDLHSPYYTISASGTVQRFGIADIDSPVWTLSASGHDSITGICTVSSPTWSMSGAGSLGRFDSYILRYVRP